MPNPRLARQFLRRVWDAQLSLMPSDRNPTELVAFLAQKSADASWTDIPLRVTEDRGVATRLPQDTTNLYYAINLFTEQRRVKRFVPGGCWLYADLDEVDPRSLDRSIKPTLAIQSSPGRYQALWLLDRWLNARALARLNQKMTYFTRADRGNWKMTQVLRVPGTVSTKREEPFEVELMWSRTASLVYSPRELMKIVGDVETPADITASKSLTLPKASSKRLVRRYSAQLPVRAKKLIRTRTVIDTEDRSSRLWELECLLLESGMKPEEVFVVVRDTVWNKWRGNSREAEQLWTEVQKAAKNVERHQANGAPKDKTSKKLKAKTLPPTEAEIADDRKEEAERIAKVFQPVTLTKYLGKTKASPAWLVDGIWGLGSHGIWAGDYKTYKSTMLCDLAISVASGRPFLGEFEVHNPGRVLMVQEENGPAYMHDKLHRIMQSKDLGTELLSLGGNRLSAHLGEKIPVEFLNMKRFDLTNDDHLRWLDAYVASEEIKLLILDPLYRLAPTLDENKATDMAPMLSWLATLADERECALILAHHYNKPKQDNAIRVGHKVSGTGVLNRWWASSVYVERLGAEEDYTVRFSTQHRDHPASPQMVARFDMPESDEDTYIVELTDDNSHSASSVEVDGDAMEKSHQRRPSQKKEQGERTATWLKLNRSKVLSWLSQIEGSFIVEDAARKLKLARSRDLTRFLEKEGYHLQTGTRNGRSRLIATKVR